MKKLSLFLLALLLIGCNQLKEPLPTPATEIGEEASIEEEKKPPKEFLSPEQIAEKIALDDAGEGRIISLLTREHNSVPVIEVLIQKEKERLVYLVDPQIKSIESVVTKDQADKGLSLEEGHFLTREHSDASSQLREIEVKEDAIYYTLKEGKGGKVFGVDKNTRKVEQVQEIQEIFDLKGDVYIDLFQALQKIGILLGDVEVQYLGYIPNNKETGAIEVRVFVEEEGETLLRTLRLDTYSGVVFYQDF